VVAHAFTHSRMDGHCVHVKRSENERVIEEEREMRLIKVKK